MGVIYKITSPSGKSYIGQTERSLDHRIRIHFGTGSKCPAIKSAIAKYGEAKMNVEVLMSVPNDELSKWEVAMIKLHETFGEKGYNMTPGGDEPPLKTKEVADRLRLTMAKPEVKAKLSEAQKRNHARPGAKEKRSNALKAAHARPETKARFKAGWKAAQSKESAKEKQRVAQTLAHKDPEIHNARMVGLRKSWTDPTIRKKKSDALKEANKRDPNINKRRSESVKRTLALKKAAAAAPVAPVAPAAPVTKRQRVFRRRLPDEYNDDSDDDIWILCNNGG